MEINSAVGRAHGISPDEFIALGDFEASAAFTPRERAALAYAESTATSNTVPDAVFDRVKLHFSDDETVELTALICFEICVAKFNRALEIEGQGICILPPRT